MNPEENPRAFAAQLAPHDERRRSQRVRIRVGVKLYLPVNGESRTIEAFTADVNDHGALIVCSEALAADSRFVLEHCRTQQRVGCRVTRRPQSTPEGFHVALEFERPSPGFWHISFPPTDWKQTED